MSSEIRRSFEKLERQKAACLGEIARWSDASVRFRPELDAWSALEVLDHLVKVERAWLDSVRKNLPNGQPVTFKERVSAYVVISVMRSQIRVKVPASAAMVLPETTAEPSETATCWGELRKEMDDLLRLLSRQQIRRGLFRHPVSGWMTMPQATAFLSAHLRHHGYQLKRLKEAAGGL